MSKMGETKQKILDSLGNKSKTLTDLSNELNLAPSTVAEHIRDLLDMNAIREIDDIPRKWKYYEINPTFSPEQYHMSFMRRQGLILSIGIVIAIAVVGSLLYITNSNYNSITACSPKPGYICGSPETNSSGTLSVVLGGQNRTIAVQGIGCSYNSSPPSAFTPYHATLAANQGARLNVSCPQLSTQQASQSTVVHIWLNYTSNGVGVVAEVANVTRPPAYYTTVPPTTTVQPTTTVPYTTIPQYYQNGNSNGTVLQSASGGSVLIPAGTTYICAAGSYVSTIRSVSWAPDSSAGIYSSIGRGYGNLCSVLGGTASQNNYIALAGISVNQTNPLVYTTTGAPDTGITQLNFSVQDPDSEVVLVLASGGGTFITGVSPSLYCTINQNDYNQISAGWTPMVYIATCMVQTPGNYNLRVTGVSGNPQYYYGNGWVSMAAYVFPSGIPPSTTTIPTTSTIATTSTIYTTSTVSTTSVPTTTTVVPQYCGILKTIYVNQTLTCQGYMVLLTDLSQPAQNQSNSSAADLSIYYNGAYQTSMQIFPNPMQTALFTAPQANATLAIEVNKTSDGLYYYQRSAQVEIYTMTKQPTTTTTQTTSTVSTTSTATTTTVPVTTNQSAMYIYNQGLTPNTAAAYALFTPVFSPLYVGGNITYGQFTVHLADLSQPNNNVSSAIIYLYYNGVLTNTTQLLPGQVGAYTVSGRTITVYVNSTYAISLYNHWAKIELSSSPVTITVNQTISQGLFSLLLLKVTNSSAYFNILQNGTVIRRNETMALGHVAYV
ncbi:MAG: winged helix-turn-helix domain-containing protein [Candidatus Micrarchaeales archaeon]|nr:winged helix-turn-helix domain-containing protein [Candidatus Micrarchaeales archaeon]